MLEHAHGLTPAALDAIAALERDVVAADGGRLKLEWGTLRTRPSDRVQDVLWWDDGRLLGFAGLYGRAGAPVELAGMVAPAARRDGIGRRLLAAALGLSQDTALAPLLIVPRASAGGHALAHSYGGSLDHSEHALVLEGEPHGDQVTDGVTLRPATADDYPTIAGLIEAGFGGPPQNLGDDGTPTRGLRLMVDYRSVTVGTLRVTGSDEQAGVYGFVIDPAYQGRGLGRESLRQVCAQLVADGTTRIGLEVAVDNERALTLYTSLGFAPVTTEDYYAIPLQRS